MRLSVLALFALILTLVSCDDGLSVVQSPIVAQPARKKEAEEPVLSAELCERLRLEALDNGCIDAEGFRALKVLEMAPKCSTANSYEHWVSCEYPFLDKIKRITKSVESCPKIGGQGECELVREHLTLQEPGSGNGQRIMIIDGFDEFPGWRYKSRILGLLKTQKDGHLATDPATMWIPRALRDVHALIASEYSWLSPKSLAPFGPEYERSFFGWHWMFMHGYAIFNQLAEFNPKAEFLLVDYAYIPEEEACRAEVSDIDIKRIRNFVRNQANSTIEYINKYKINYINFSQGVTPEGFRASFEKKCRISTEFSNELSRIYFEEYLVPLSRLEEVIFVHASTHASNPLRTMGNQVPTHEEILAMNDQDLNSLTDCVELPNRLRVGHASLYNPRIPENGSDDRSLINDIAFLNADACTDIYLNGGAAYEEDGPILETPPIEGRETCLWVTSDGIRSHPALLAGSSYTAPLAISLMIQMKRENPSLTPRQLIQEVKKGGKIKDPLRHQLHPFKVFGSQDFQDVINAHLRKAAPQ